MFKEFIQKLLMRSASAAQSTGFIKQYAAPPERSSRSTIELSAGIMAIKRGEFSPIASRHCFITQSISEFCINASQITISGFPLKIAEASLFPSRSINSAKNPAPSASEQERQNSLSSSEIIILIFLFAYYSCSALKIFFTAFSYACGGKRDWEYM